MSTYLLSRREDGTVERDRLVLLERFHDPFTVRHLDAIGVGPGWSCLDAGAGSGSVTRMLAERVTSTRASSSRTRATRSRSGGATCSTVNGDGRAVPREAREG